MKGYQIIAADPAWHFKTRGKTSPRHASHKYKTMSLADICALPVEAAAAPNSALLLWTTRTHLEQAFSVIKSWGFTYKSIAFVWIKITKNLKFHFGMGYYTRANSEICLLATRGTMPVTSRSESEVIPEYDLLAPVGEHSQKPEKFYQAVDELWPNTRRLEIFASSHSAKLSAAHGFERSLGFDVDGQDLAESLSNIL